MRYQHAAALAAAAAAAGLAPAAALATAPGTNGQIAFRRYLGPDRTKGAIFVAAPDGSGERQLTTAPANASDDYPDVALGRKLRRVPALRAHLRHLHRHTDGTGGA